MFGAILFAGTTFCLNRLFSGFPIASSVFFYYIHKCELHEIWKQYRHSLSNDNSSGHYRSIQWSSSSKCVYKKNPQEKL